MVENLGEAKQMTCNSKNDHKASEIRSYKYTIVDSFRTQEGEMQRRWQDFKVHMCRII